jgi:putative ABC transport system permease protein
MLKNILKITFRNMFKNKLYTFINISGLAIGIAGCLLILSYVKYEVEFDTFHKDADKIFRVVTDVTMRDGTKMNTCLSSPGLVNYLQEDFPQIESATRIYPMNETRIEFENCLSIQHFLKCLISRLCLVIKIIY